MSNIIFLYGPPASGKSTLGKRLATALKTTFIDLDAVIAERAGMSISEVFAAEGEDGFRDRESAALKMVSDSNVDAVIALGGGTLLREANRKLCEEKGAIWCLDTPSEAELARRITPPSRTASPRSSKREIRWWSSADPSPRRFCRAIPSSPMRPLLRFISRTQTPLSTLTLNL